MTMQARGTIDGCGFMDASGADPAGFNSRHEKYVI
jgi:hypothetical protein